MKRYKLIAMTAVMAVIAQFLPVKAFAFSAEGYEWEIISDHEVRCDGFVWGKSQAIARIPATVKNYKGTEYTCTYIYNLNYDDVIEEIYVPSTVKELQDGVFAYNHNLREIHFPNDIQLKILPLEMFVNCTSLKELTFPNIVDPYVAVPTVTIPQAICQNCQSLEKIIIPYTQVSKIQDYAFGKCSNLKDLYIYSVIPPEISEYAFDELTYYGAPAKIAKEKRAVTLHVPAESLDAYKASAWSEYFTEIVVAPENPEEAAIEEITVDNNGLNRVKYYTVDGHIVDSPVNGHIYIKTDGCNTTKILYTDGN